MTVSSVLEKQNVEYYKAKKLFSSVKVTFQ